MSRRFRPGSATQPAFAGVCLLVALAILLLVAASQSALAQASNTLVTTPALWRGGDKQPITWQGGDASSVEFSADKGVNWTQLTETGPSPLQITIPTVDSSNATIRVMLADGLILTSDAFVVDSTAPVSALTGRPFMSLGRGNVPKGRVVMPFDAVGPDVASLQVTFTPTGGGEAWSTPWITADQAAATGFPAPPDGLYHLTLTARDRVGNIETKSQPDFRDFIVDSEAPLVRISTGAGAHAIGGSKLAVEWEAVDPNLDLATLKFEYVAGGVIIETIDAGEARARGSFEWTLPREDQREARIRATVADRAGNQASAESEPFLLFSGRPQAVIVDERSEAASEAGFDLAFLNAASLKHLNMPWRVDLYSAAWDAARLQWVWDTANPYRDLPMRVEEDGRSVITFSASYINKAFLARLVVGDGNNQLTEPAPSQASQPESVFHGLTRIARATLVEPKGGLGFIAAGSPITLSYKIPGDLYRGSTLILEYSPDSGESWLPINDTPITILRDRLEDTFTWSNPPQQLEFTSIRALTGVTIGTIEYRVADLMKGGIVVDSRAPRAEIIRVLDANGRPLASGDYTNSRRFTVEWRVTDTGGSGVVDAVLWDNARFAAGRAPDSHAWNRMKFSPGSLEPSSEPRAMDLRTQETVIDFGDFAGPVGKIGLIVEGIDRAGNRRFPDGEPPADAAPAFELNIDYLPPVVRLTSQPPGAELMPGSLIRLEWTTSDIEPNPRIADSLGANPVSVYALDADGNASLLATGLPANGGLEVPVPALTDQMVRFTVAARDRAGNASGVTEGATTRPALVQNAALPEVRLRRGAVSLDAGVTLNFEWDQTRGRASELATLTLWVTTNAGQSWTRAGEFAPGQRVTFALPGPDDDFAFSLTATSNAGLAEPTPRSVRDTEEVWIVDTQAPSVQIEVRPDRPMHFVGDEPPIVRAIATDRHFRAAGTRLTATRVVEGSPVTTETLRQGDNFTNGEWVETPVELGAAPGTITLRIESEDGSGNTSWAEAIIEVRIRPAFVVHGLSGTEPYYARTPRDITWDSTGEGAGTGRVKISLRPVRMVDGAVMPTGNAEIVLAGSVMDTGRFTIPGGLPDAVGEWLVVLEALDAPEPLPPIVSQRVFKIVHAEPWPVLAPHPDQVRLEDGTPVFAGLGSLPLQLSINHVGEDERPYELTIESASIRWRHTGTDGTTTEWQNAPAALVPGTPARVGRFRVNFLPENGEGIYELAPMMRDIYGYASPDPPVQILSLVVDGGPPVVTLTSPSGPKSVYTDEDVATLRFRATDPLLDVESIHLQYRAFGETEWKTLHAERILDETPAGSSTGSFAPTFDQPGRYLVRVMASDLVGQTGYGMLASPVYSGSGNYVAIRPIPAHGTDPAGDYTTPYSSRRAKFRVHVEPIRPWEEGLRSLTLWWRYTEHAGDRPSQWFKIDFDQRHLIGEQPVDTTQSLDAETYLNSLPFEARVSGRYDFIVTSESMWGQLESPQLPDANSEPEMTCMVFAEPLSMTASLKPAGGIAVPRIDERLRHGELEPGETYQLHWTLRVPASLPEIHRNYALQISHDAGETWGGELELQPLPERDTEDATDPEDTPTAIAGLGYSTTVANVSYDGGKTHFREYRHSAPWSLPVGSPKNSSRMLLLRVVMRESAAEDLAPMETSAHTSSYAVGLRPESVTTSDNNYYERLVAAGNKAREGGDLKRALELYTQARAQNSNPEIEKLVGEVQGELDAANPNTIQPKVEG